MIENTALAVLPLIAALLIMATRFYAREGAISLFSPSFLLAALSMLLLFAYMALKVLVLLPDYAWVGFGGFGVLVAVGGVLSFFR